MHLAALILSAIAGVIFFFGGFRRVNGASWPMEPSGVAGFLLAVAVFLLSYSHP